MEDHDQRLKTLVRECFAWFLALILPGWSLRFNLIKTEWLRQEYFTNPPTGERRILDMVARLVRIVPDAKGHKTLIVNVEIESEDSATRARQQTTDHHRVLWQAHKTPVLPLVLYLSVGLEGRGHDSLVEMVDDLAVNTCVFPYLGLPRLMARD